MSALPVLVEEAPAVSPAMEDYLRAVYRLGSEGARVTPGQVARAVGVSGPSATNMVKRLTELGYLVHAPYGTVALTPAGEREALRVTRNHRLLELYLVRSLGYGWDEAHAEADRLEHHLSPVLTHRLDASLGHPATDPHGDPIPRADGTVAAEETLPLSELPIGDAATVRRVADGDPARLRHLGELGLVPGAEVVVGARLPFDGPLRVTVAGDERLVGPLVAAAVQVALTSIDN